MIFLPKRRAFYVLLEKGLALEKGHDTREKGHGVTPW